MKNRIDWNDDILAGHGILDKTAEQSSWLLSWSKNLEPGPYDRMHIRITYLKISLTKLC